MAVSFLKRAGENLDYDFDFAAIMPVGDSLQAGLGTSTVTVPVGLTAGTKSHNTATSVVKQFLSGGTTANSYSVTCQITTTQGRILEREITLLVGTASTFDVPTPAELATHIETDLNQEALQRLIDNAQREVVVQFGDNATQQDYLGGGGRWLFPQRSINTVTSIVETIGDTNTTLAANDYAVRGSGWRIERLATGTNAANIWAPHVTLTYVPTDETARRKQIMIDLVKLAVQFSGLQETRDGDHWETSLDYTREQRRILNRLQSSQRVFA